MTAQQKLESIAILAKHLRTYTPLLAAIGSSRRLEVKQELFSDLGEQILQDEKAKQDILRLLNNLLGENLDTIDFLSIRKRLQGAWKANKMDEALSVCVQIGILKKSDLANFVWVITNWRKDGISRSTG